MSGNIFFDVTDDLGGNTGKLTLHGEFYAQSKLYFSNVAGTVAPGTTIKGYALANARLSWGDMFGTRISSAFYVRNLFNKKYYAGGNAWSARRSASTPACPASRGCSAGSYASTSDRSEKSQLSRARRSIFAGPNFLVQSRTPFVRPGLTKSTLRSGTMRAVRYDDYGGPDVLYLGEMPDPVAGSGQLLVRIAAAGVNPADGKWRAGMFKDFLPIEMPHVPGYDIAGTVEAVGPDVTGYKPGDRIVSLLGNTTHGAYAELAAADAAASARLPDDFDFALAAALPVAAHTAVQMIEEQIKPARGETVLVTGALGAVGRWLVHAALAQGAKVVAAVRPAHAEEARALGASEVIPLDGGDDLEPQLQPCRGHCPAGRRSRRCAAG